MQSIRELKRCAIGVYDNNNSELSVTYTNFYINAKLHYEFRMVKSSIHCSLSATTITMMKNKWLKYCNNNTPGAV